MLITAKPINGASIQYSIDEAIGLACDFRGKDVKIHRSGPLEITSTEDDDTKFVTVRFVFQGITINVEEDSDPQLIFRDWLRALRRCIPGSVGPHPSAYLSDDEAANDAKILAESPLTPEQREEFEENVQQITV